LDYRHVTKYKPTPLPPSNAQRGGRKPQGERALSGAERQARYRQRQVGNRAAPPPRPSRPIQRASRAQQWHAAVVVLVALQAEYAAWLDALPEALRDGATGEALRAIVDLDLDELVSIEPPRGFGRD
jgi:ferric-dicitrate binding protein FerR (iron transport regulator)